MSKKSLKQKCFEDKNGNVVLAQKWNLPLATWAVTTIVGVVVKTGTIGELIDLVGFGALFTWAWLELFQGVNYFRRLLGFIVLAFSLYSKIA